MANTVTRKDLQKLRDDMKQATEEALAARRKAMELAATARIDIARLDKDIDRLFPEQVYPQREKMRPVLHDLVLPDDFMQILEDAERAGNVDISENADIQQAETAEAFAPPNQVHSPLTSEMLKQITSYIETVRDEFEKYRKTANNTLGPPSTPEYQEYEHLAAYVKNALRHLLEFWQKVKPREGIQG